MSDEAQRDETHVEQHGDGDVNVNVEAPEQDTGSAEDVSPDENDSDDEE